MNGPMSASINASMLASTLSGWMVGALLIGTLCAVAAWLVHRLMRELAPARFVWGAGMVVALVVGLAMPWRGRVVAPAAANAITMPGTVATAASPSEQQSLLMRVASRLRDGAEAARNGGAATIGTLVVTVRQMPALVHWLLLFSWPVASLALATVSLLGYHRLRHRVRRAEPGVLHDTSVLISESIGPAVVGVYTPKIVVPRWLLTLPAHEQQMVLAHESEHLRARDPQLLLVACAAVICMPWNVALWWMLARLRLAIEVDCDGRVLARGTARRPYGELLLAISSRPSGLQLLPPIPAFSFRVTHLERRLRTMTARPSTHSALRCTGGILVTAAALLAACGAELPTSAELEGMDVAAATQRLDRIATSAERRFYIDDRVASEEEAKALPAERLASIQIVKEAQGVQAVRLRTRTATGDRAAPPAGGTPVVSMEIRSIDSTSRALRVATSVADREARTDSVTGRELVMREVVAFGKNGTADSTRRITMSSAGASPKPFEGLIIIDGVKSTAAAMNAISPNNIVSVEVVKGTAGLAKYGADGAKGVVVITTKK